MAFNPRVIQEGNATKKAAEETPNVFATEGGSSSSFGTVNLDQRAKLRKAGPGGAFAMQMMQDPELAQRVAQWNAQFAESNQGMQFNQAKIQAMMGQMTAEANSDNQQTQRTNQQNQNPQNQGQQPNQKQIQQKDQMQGGLV